MQPCDHVFSKVALALNINTTLVINKTTKIIIMLTQTCWHDFGLKKKIKQNHNFSPHQLILPTLLATDNQQTNITMLTSHKKRTFYINVVILQVLMMNFLLDLRVSRPVSEHVPQATCAQRAPRAQL